MYILHSSSVSFAWAGVSGLDTHIPFVFELCRDSQALSGQCGSLMSTGVASYVYVDPSVVGCCHSVALEHGSEAEVEFGTGSVWDSHGASAPCEISNPPSFLCWRYPEFCSWSAI